MKGWEEMLDECVLHPEPMAWHQHMGLRMTLAQKYTANQECLEKGYIEWGGAFWDGWKGDLYRVTPAGLAYWRKHIQGRRTRPSRAPPVPKWTRAQLAAASSPVSVWDLSRVPYFWKKSEDKRDP